MKALLQRVSEASVSLEGEELSAIQTGIVVLVCTEREDTDEDADFFARKIANMRLFADDEGKTNRSIGIELVISEKTVARHLSNIFIKLEISSRSAATAYAYDNNLLQPPT